MDPVGRLQFAFRSFEESYPHRTENIYNKAYYVPLGYSILTADFTVSGPDHEVKAFLQQIQNLYQDNRLIDWRCSLNLSVTSATADVRCSVHRDPNDTTPALLTLQRAALPSSKED